jgi:PAS domain S-box-containing protein
MLRIFLRSLRGKIFGIVLLTTATALAVAGAALLLTDLQENRRNAAADLETEAGILALSTAPALAFDDRSAAQRSLEALQARASLQTAALYAADGSLFASYTRRGEEPPPSIIPPLAPGVHVDGERLELVQPVSGAGELLGNVYFRSQYDLAGRIRAYLGVLTVVMLLSLAVALTASVWLQKVITLPLDAMAGVARRIAEGQDYSLRAEKTSQDEVGLVVDVFNSMLTEVQTRTRALEQANQALHEEVAERLAAEQALRTSEKLYRAIGESIEYGVWICDASGRNIYASESFLRLAGITQQQCSDLGWGDALHPEDAEATITAWKMCVAQGSNWYREHRFRGADGKYHSILAQGVPIRDEHGSVTGWAGINLDISRLKNTEEALREADRRKDDFLATLAHELRNPLAPIRHAVRILDSPAANDEQKNWGLQVIARQVHQMALLLEDLLDVSRITRTLLELRKDFVKLETIVDVARETAKPLIESKQHLLEIVLPSAPVTLAVDPLRLSQVVSNLLTNAAKYTNSGGRIVLAATVNSTDLQISVKDSGIGLVEETIPSLFNMFSQVSTALDRAEGGLGIGLALVKGIVSLHGGTVTAHSEGLGKGSEFIVHLPNVVVDDAVMAATPEPADEQAGRPPRGKVLVADDNRDAALSLAALLELSGYKVSTAFNGAEALAIGARDRPQAILLDIGMPGMNGYEVARRIRREAWGRRAVLVAITGWGQEGDRKLANEAGFDHHLTKPVDLANIEKLLENL